MFSRFSPRDQPTNNTAPEAATRRGGVDYKNKVAGLINTYAHHKSQPTNIEADQLYGIQLIASPIFDANGGVVFNLGLGGFSQKRGHDQWLRRPSDARVPGGDAN